MKVRIEMTVDVDSEAWSLNYGCDRSEVREDVQSYAKATVLDQLTYIGVLR